MLPVATYKSRDTPKPFVVWRTKQGHVVVVFNKIWQENIWPNCFKFINLRDFGGWMPNPITAIWGDKPGGRYILLGKYGAPSCSLGIFMDFWPPTVGWNMAMFAWKHQPRSTMTRWAMLILRGAKKKLIEIILEIFFTKLTLVGSVHFSGIDGRFPLWKGFNVVVKTPWLPMYLDTLPKLNSAGAGDLCPETWVSKYFQAVETRWVWRTCFNKSSTK